VGVVVDKVDTRLLGGYFFESDDRLCWRRGSLSAGSETQAQNESAEQEETGGKSGWDGHSLMAVAALPPHSAERLCPSGSLQSWSKRLCLLRFEA
jgi:hypothetical protein